jgi:hypothetical protein
MTDHTADPISEARERGLLPNGGIDELLAAISINHHGDAPRELATLKARRQLNALAARLLELLGENERLSKSLHMHRHHVALRELVWDLDAGMTLMRFDARCNAHPTEPTT